MKPRFAFSPGFPVLIKSALIFFCSSLVVPATTWDNSNSTGTWSTGANWDSNVEPTSADAAIFPAGLSGTITLASGENAKSLQFDNAYTLNGGTLTLAAASSIGVANGVTATISSGLTLTGGSSKTGNGTLVLAGSTTNATGMEIAAGTLRVTNTNGLGAAGAIVNAATFLEISGTAAPNSPILLRNGGTVTGIGSPVSNGTISIDAAATSVSLATASGSDVLTLGNGANDLTGGTASTVIGVAGPGAVRLAASSDFDGSWSVPSGRLEIAVAGALGDQATSPVTLSGGVLSARANTGFTATGPGSNLLVTASSGLASDRSTAGAGVTHTFGTLSMGSHTLAVAPGTNSTSGTAGITLGNLTLTGNPEFAVNDSGAANGKLTTGALLGGGIARAVTKSGAGDLAVTGGATDLPAGSSLVATGGGIIEMLFPELGSDASVAVTAAQNPFGSASISVTDGNLRLLANGSNTSAVQTFQLASTITLGGAITLDVDERSGSNSVKTFELSGLTLTSGTTLSLSGANTYGVRLTSPLVLQGNATLKGSDTASRPGILTLDGGLSCGAATSVSLSGGTSPLTLTINGSGIAGGPSTAVTLGGGTNPLTLTVNASGTYGGGTIMTGGNVTLAAANALGSGSLVMNGGSLVVNADNPLGGSITLNGGTLRVNDTNALAANPVNLDGGILDFRNNTTAVISTGTLTVSGTSTLSLGNNGAGSSQGFDFPAFNVSGNTLLTVTSLNSFIPNFQNIGLAGNLTLSSAGTVRVQTITQDASPRTLIKAGAGTLELEAANNHSGGTEVIAGTLLVEAAGALGGGSLTLGDTSGSTAASAQFVSGLTVANNIVARAGSSGLLTLGSPAGNVNWNGDLNLQNALTLANGGTAAPSYLNGMVSGAGILTKSNVNSEIALGNAANSFTGSIVIAGGTLTVASDGALGNAANGVSLTGTTSALKVNGTFATSRTLTFTSTPVGVNVTAGNEFTVNQALAGGGSFLKTGPGIMTLGPAVDSSGRSGATSGINGGTLRLQGPKNLSDTGIITLNGTSGTIELLRDANTTFPHPVTATGTGIIHTDRSIGGSGTNGRHTLGSLGMSAGNLTVTGANGYGLTFGALTTTSSSTLINNAPGELQLASMGANAASGSPAMSFGGSGTTRITGAINSGVQANYGITKTGPGTLRFGTGVLGFARAAVVNDGILDINGLSYSVNALTLGGAASTIGSRLVTGAGGSLVLGGTLTFTTFSPAASQAGAMISGNLDVGAASRSFVIGDNATLPVDLDISGSIIGSAGAAIAKSGLGTLRFSGAGNTQPGLVTVSAGVLELAKSSGDAIGIGGLSTATAGIVRLVAGEQINNNASVSIGTADESFLELNNFTETVGPLTITQSDTNDYSAVKTGATGTLILTGSLTLANNSSSSATDGREVLITGSGGEITPTTNGTLDLGGVTRTIHVTTTTVGTNEPKANATIETRVINGGILKTGPRTLFLTNPDNTFAGGLQIAQGYVRPGTGTSLGLGPITFSNAPGIAAGIDLNTLTGTLTNDIATSGGTGEAGFTYSALAPNSLILSGAFNIGGDAVFNVIEGTVIKGNSSVLDVTGPITDGAGTFGIRKIGNGTLKLAAGNTYGGATAVEKGILAIAADSALGDTTAALTIDGGCLASSGSFVLTRDIVIGSNGGNLRADDISHTMELSGVLTWSSGTTTIDGIGRTVISGNTTGPGGNLVLGAPIAFATGITTSTSWSSRVCLQGAAVLPAGNLSIVNGAVLELGNSDFTRPLGTSAGEVQFPSYQGGGWAAVGANRSVNIGGAGAAVVWGQVSPPFLYNAGLIGPLILGSISATHTVEFQNPVNFVNGVGSGTYRNIITNDGTAAVDARISSNLGVSALTTLVALDLTSRGTLEITGNILGNVALSHVGSGTSILSGSNELLGDLSVDAGILKFANDASFGNPQSIEVAAGATLDASSMTLPVVTATAGDYIFVDGSILGNVSVTGSLNGTGQISGNVTAQTFSYIDSGFDGTLHILGNLNLQPSSGIHFEIGGTVAEQEYNRIRVTGTVNLGGEFYFDSFNANIPLGFTGTLALILNDGSDPITPFASFPEGTTILIGDRPFQVTYLANGDGGPVGNDFGVIAVNTGLSPFDIWINSFPGLTNPLDKTKDANPDKDALNNLGEFALDGNPSTGTSSGKIVGKIAQVGGVDAMTLTIPVAIGTILDPIDPPGGELILVNALAGLTYRLQASDTLSSFDLDVSEVTGFDASMIQNGLPGLNSGWIYRSFRSPGPVSGDPSEFIRCQIDE